MPYSVFLLSRHAWWGSYNQYWPFYWPNSGGFLLFCESLYTAQCVILISKTLWMVGSQVLESVFVFESQNVCHNKTRCMFITSFWPTNLVPKRKKHDASLVIQCNLESYYVTSLWWPYARCGLVLWKQCFTFMDLLLVIQWRKCASWVSKKIYIHTVQFMEFSDGLLVSPSAVTFPSCSSIWCFVVFLGLSFPGSARVTHPRPGHRGYITGSL